MEGCQKVYLQRDAQNTPNGWVAVFAVSQHAEPRPVFWNVSPLLPTHLWTEEKAFWDTHTSFQLDFENQMLPTAGEEMD